MGAYRCEICDNIFCHHEVPCHEHGDGLICEGCYVKLPQTEIKVKCVCCGYTKIVGKEQKEMPMCDKCFSPMIAQEVSVNPK